MSRGEGDAGRGDVGRGNMGRGNMGRGNVGREMVWIGERVMQQGVTDIYITTL